MSTCPRCDGLLREDTQFTAEMLAYGLPQRRSVCLSGHSVYVGLPVLEAPKISGGAPVKLPNPSRRVEGLCPQCAGIFSGTTRQKYCGPACTRAADTERNANRRRPGKQMTGDELRAARAIPRPWNSWRRNGTAPQAYAARPKGLSQKWA